MDLCDILQLKGFNHQNVKVIRHSTSRAEIKALIASGDFELYQSYQKSDVFNKANYIITFSDLEGKKALLKGVYKVNEVKIVSILPNALVPISNLEDWESGPYYHYNLTRDNSLSDLEERLVINWGVSTLSWHQWKLDKEVVEILPKGFVKTFPGYENVVLLFDELEKIIKNPDANRQWKEMLSNVYGVYLILDTTNGQQYVGSAYGKDGIWLRWSNYVQNKHGGNKLLIDILNNDPLRYKKFQFSILNVLPNSSLHEQIIQLENVTKEKLGTRVYGLNSN